MEHLLGSRCWGDRGEWNGVPAHKELALERG